MRVFAITAMLVAAACSNAPISEVKRPGYPCGINGVVCVQRSATGALVSTGMCCSEGEVCGGTFPNVGCPAGQCCFVGGDGMDGALPPHAQRDVRIGALP
jgi:hypothetical protein